MTREDALKVLVKMRAWRRWGKGEQNEKDMPEMPEQKEVDEAFDVFIETLSQPSLPSNLDEAELKYVEFSDCPPANQEEELMVYNAFKSGAEWMAGQGWHDVTETPSIFGFFLVIHEKGWCVANYMGKGTVCESGWVEAIHHIEIKRPQKWLDLRDLIPKKQ